MKRIDNVFITGDIHGDLTRIIEFYNRFKDMFPNIVVIILGDAGFNCNMPSRDRAIKEKANSLGITFFCVKGNHEIHPDHLFTYETKEWNGGEVYFEEEFPNILFARDGEIFDINGLKTLVIGGAYSVDKYYRLMAGWFWTDTEQPSEETKAYVMKKLNQVNWKVDVVLSHTAPLKAEPRHLFLSHIDQRTVDKSTEEFLDEISDKLDFKKWYFGHYHGDWNWDKYYMLFTKIEEFKV